MSNDIINPTFYPDPNNDKVMCMCERYMPFTKKTPNIRTNTNLIAVISVSSLILFLILLVPFNIYLFFRMKKRFISKLNEQHKMVQLHEYDDVSQYFEDQNNIYEVYQELNEENCCVNSILYLEITNIHKEEL